MSLLVKSILRFVMFLLLQVYVLDNIVLHKMVTPYLYFLFLLWLPFKINRSLLLCLGFALGYSLDSFRHQPGFHTAACVLVAYVRPFLVNILIPHDGAETNYEAPSIKSFGGIMPYMIFAGVLCFLHNAWLFLLEAWQFENAWYFISKTLLSTLISLMLIFVTELIFVRKQKFKTNTN